MCSFNPSSLPHCLDHYSRYLSILDVDQKTLHCPTYSGSLINLLVEPKSHFKRGNTYFTFAQSVQSKLVTKAFLLTFSHGHHSPSRPQGSSGTECFLSELHTDDKKILRYLSELIKLHFMEVTPNVLLFSYTTTSIFKLWKSFTKTTQRFVQCSVVILGFDCRHKAVLLSFNIIFTVSACCDILFTKGTYTVIMA